MAVGQLMFSVLAQVCGLSHQDAADFFDVRLDTAKSWATGRRNPPDGVIEDLAALAARIDAAADAIFETVIENIPGAAVDGTVEMGLASDDHEARSLGWPCVGAQRAALGLAAARIMAEGFTVVVAPRGSTSATAAAADAHDA